MILNILVVDDNAQFLNLFEKIFNKFSDRYKVHTALTVKSAIGLVRTVPFSLIVTDIQMPGVDGTKFILTLKKHFSDIPVIVVTGFDNAETKSAAFKAGADAYYTKPLIFDDFLHSIHSLVAKQTEGGKLNNASIEMFIQLVEMEAKTCTLRVKDDSSQKQGVLFFQEGELVHARCNTTYGNEAAYQIFSWTRVTLSIENRCLVPGKTIKGELQAILLEAMRLKDESCESEADEDGPDGFPLDGGGLIPEEAFEEPAQSYSEQLRQKVGTVLDDPAMLDTIEQNELWDEFMRHAGELGTFFQSGELKACYIHNPDGNDSILLPGGATTVVSVSPKCPREKIVHALTK